VRITQVTLFGFKGTNGAYPLKPRLLLTGPNGSGKSSIMEAIRYACTGTTDLGSAPAASFEYATGDRMHVSIDTDDGLHWVRGVERRNGGKLREWLTINGVEAGVREAHGALGAKIGNFTPMWRPSDFLALSADKRREFVLGLAGGGPKLDLWPEIVKAAEADGTTPDCQAMNWAAGVLADARGPAAAKLGQLISATKERVNALAAQVRNGARAVEKLRSALAMDGPPTGDAETICAEAAALRQQRDVALADLARREGLDRAATSLRMQLTGLVETARDLQTALSERARPEIQAQTKKKEAESLLAEAATIRKHLKDPGEAPVEPPGDETVEAHRLARECSEKLAALKAQKQIAEDEMARLGASDAAEALKIYLYLAEHEPIEDGAKWRHLGRLLKTLANEGRCADLDDEIRDLSGQISETEDVLTKLLADFEDVRTVHAAKCETYRAALDAWTAANQEVLPRERKAASLEAQAQALLGEIDSYKAEHDRLLDDQKTVAETRAKVSAELDTLLSEAGSDAADLKQLVAGIDGQLRDLDAALEVHARRQAQLDNHARVLKCSDDDEALLEATKKVLGVLKQVRERIVSDTLAPIQGALADVLSRSGVKRQPILSTEDDQGRADFRLGWVTETGRSVSVDTMSGGERVMFLGALSTALASMAEPPLRVLMLDAGELDHHHLKESLRGLVGLEQGNIIVATHLPIAADPEGWQVMRMGHVEQR
jgi:DNA repair exonuclease SbcCD ATPase subunit